MLGLSPTALLVGAAALVGAVVLFGTSTGQTVASDLLAAISGRGARIGPKTTADDRGVIPDDPQSLADAAALDLPTYALARAISSEEGNQPLEYKVAVGWAMVNKAGGAGKVADLLLRGKGDVDGRFAAQNARTSDGGSGGKYASTKLDPHEDDATIALAIVRGQVPDPTNGATNFFSPRLQDQLAARGDAGYVKDAAAVDASWRSSGLEPVAVADIDPQDLTFYRRA